MECPRCGDELKIKNWYEDHWMVEEKRWCSCGYIWHWAYGSLIESESRSDETRCDKGD